MVFFVQQPHKQQESRMQQQQKQLSSTYSTGANFSTTVVGNSATKSPNSSVDRKVINTLQIQPIDSGFCDTVKNCTWGTVRDKADSFKGQHFSHLKVFCYKFYR